MLDTESPPASVLTCPGTAQVLRGQERQQRARDSAAGPQPAAPFRRLPPIRGRHTQGLRHKRHDTGKEPPPPVASFVPRPQPGAPPPLHMGMGMGRPPGTRAPGSRGRFRLRRRARSGRLGRCAARFERAGHRLRGPGTQFAADWTPLWQGLRPAHLLPPPAPKGPP